MANPKPGAPKETKPLAVSHGESMEKPTDFWLRTEGTAGSVVPTIDTPEYFNEAGAVRRKTQSVCEGREREGEVGEWLKPPVC